NPDCSLVDRAGFLAQIGRGSTVKSLGIEDVLIRVLGDVALIHARTTYTRPDGQPGAGRYTDVWARRGSRWVCVAAHVTRLGAGPAPDVARGGSPALAPASIPRGAGRDGAARRQRPVRVVLLMAQERRTEDADQMEIRVRAQPVAVLGPDVVAHAG